MNRVEGLLREGYAAEEAGDLEHARWCFETAAHLGETIGMTWLGYMFDTGVGVTVDKAEAMRWYRRAWRQRCDTAANNIAILYRERGDHRAMFRWFQRSAAAGNGDAYLEIAKCYLSGVGVRRSHALAVRSVAAVLTHEYVTEASVEEAEAMMADLRPRLVATAPPTSSPRR